MSDAPKTTNVKINGNPIPWLFEYVKREINLGSFLENELGCNLIWAEQDISGKCVCPLPNHRDKAPSFTVTRLEDGQWVYNCFGCSSGGTIIDFCKEYYGHGPIETLKFLCKKFDIKEGSGVLRFDFPKKVHYRKKIECAHIVIANQCRMLLRKDQKKHSKFVSSVYRKLNKILDDESQETLDALDKLEFKICRMLGE